MVIEHNLDVIKTADHIIDLGPESGDNGGEVIAVGTPEQISEVKNSYTGQFLKPILESARKKGQYATRMSFIDDERLKSEAMEIATGPRVRRKAKENGV